MQSNPTVGILILCSCTLLPFLAGIAATVFWQRRLALFGWPGALLPGVIRRWLEKQ